MEAKPEERGAERRQPAQRDRRGRDQEGPGQLRRDGRRSPAPAPAQPGAPLPPQPAAAEHAAGERQGGGARRRCRRRQRLARQGCGGERARRPRTPAWTRRPAQLVQSGPIAEARAAQGELDQAAKEDPAKVLAKQQEALGKAEGDMAALQVQALAALTASRAGHRQGHRRAPGRHGRLRGVDARQGRRRGQEGLRRGADGGRRALLKDLAAERDGGVGGGEDRARRPVQGRPQDRARSASTSGTRAPAASSSGCGTRSRACPGWAEEAYDRGREELRATA